MIQDGRYMKTENNEYYKNLYDVYYSSKLREKQDKIWKEICKYFDRFILPENNTPDGIIVDVAGGACNFINNISSDCKKYVIDLNPDTRDKYAMAGVTAIIDRIENLPKHFKPETVSMFFVSNFLEHITKQDIRQFFDHSFRLLRKGGELWIMTPNIRLSKGAFWDWFDHITPLTERALISEAIVHGYKVRYVIPKFVPAEMQYTKKPKFPFLVRWYLRLLPLSGYIFGGQSFIILRKY